MSRLAFFTCLLVAAYQTVFATCPTPLPPLPKLTIPPVIPPPHETCPTPKPDTLSGYFPITLVNDSGLSADDIYVVILVNSSQQFLSFSGSPHKLAKISHFTPTTYLSDSPYTYPLSSFEKIQDNTYTFYIPNNGNSGISGSNVMKSSRILISLKQPLTYFINNVGILQFPSEFDAKNDNYFVLNDKIEFDIGSNKKNRLVMNLTGVDFFGLPLLIQASYKFFYGNSYTDCCEKTGMPVSISLSDVFTKYNASLNNLPYPFNEYWEGLVASYTNPQASGADNCPLRIYAPATAMGSTQTQSNPSKVSFPTNYFLKNIVSPDSCTWFSAVWNGTTKSGQTAYYQNTTPTPYLIVDATTSSGAATAKGNEQSDGSFNFVISGGPDDGKNIVFPYPTSSKAFFTGAVSDYEPAITGSASSASKSQVLKVFASCIISGIMPINCEISPPITLTEDYVQTLSSEYFKNNPILTAALNSCPCVANVPWYDFYSRTLLTIGTPNLFYTSAYSDFLGSDGSIVITSLNTHNANATITVNLNDCSTGIHFPDPYSDTTKYNVTIGIPSKTTVKYGTSKSGPFTAIITQPFAVNGDSFFLQVTYHSGPYANKTFVTQIAPAAQIFHPILPEQGKIITSGTNSTVYVGGPPT